MFCSKTSIGIDNYRRYGKGLYNPSYKMLLIAMGISVIISGICFGFAVGFDSKPANQLTGVYLDKLCWFNHTVNHYFLTIPVCLFLAIHLVLFILVVKSEIKHARGAYDLGITEQKKTYLIRRKRCMYVLLASASTQGFGWLLGPVISLASPSAANVLGWFFIIFNGLEGLWAILIYIIIEKEGLNRSRRRQDSIDRQPDNDDNGDGDDHDDSQNRYSMQNSDAARRHDPLKGVRSDSPRHSFANLTTI
jgi:hypothetical protein